MAPDVPFQCPFCTHNLSRADGYVCSFCDRTFPVHDGIPVLSAERRYWNPIPQDRMRHYLDTMEAHGWAAGFRLMLADAPPEQRETRRRIVLDDTRTSWVFLLDIPMHGAVLDLGCGLGTVSVHLSRYYDHVVSADLTLERLQFLRHRATALGLSNLTYVCAGDTPTLPFPAGYFDAVVINGVLEWVPEGRTGHPTAIQVTFLKEAHRMLKQSGQLYLAIENRIAYEYFLGRPDHHSYLLYGSLLPRFLANVYSRITRGQPYRTYTYTRWGYGRLLRRAGFLKTRFYSTLPDYRHIEQIVDLGERSQMRIKVPVYRRQSRVAGGLLASRLYTYFAPSFAIVAAKGPMAARFLDGLLESVSRELNARAPNLGASPLAVAHCAVSAKGVLILRCRSGTHGVMLRIPMNDVAYRHLRQHVAVTRQLRAATDIPGHLKAFTPTPLLDGTYRRVPYFAETELSGISAADLRSAAALDVAVREGAAFISALHRAPTGPDVALLDSPHYEALVGCCVAVLDEGLIPHGRRLSARVSTYLRDALTPHRLGLVWYMGDFGVSNLLVDSHSGVLSGVIDWDRGAKAGLPVLDLMHLLASHLRHTAGLAPGEALRRVFFPGSFDDDQQRLVTAYCDSASIPRALLQPLCLIWWLRYLQGRLEYGSEFDHDWMDRNVHGVGEYLAAHL